MLNVRGGTGRARRLWRVAGNQVGQALLMMALSRTSLFSDLSPFSVAWFTAGLSAGRPPWAMLVGCALGLSLIHIFVEIFVSGRTAAKAVTADNA